MNKKKFLMFGLPILALVLVSAALLTFYGQIRQDVDVRQAVVIGGCENNVCTETVSGTTYGDDLVSAVYTLTNNDPDNSRDVELVTRYNPGIASGEIVSTIEYKLDSAVDDDALFVVLDSSILWSDFTEATFDYLIESDGGNLWIPQMNVKLVDGNGDMQYYASWHSFRTGITGVIGVEESKTFDKGDFYIYGSDWSLMGLYKGLDQGTKDLIGPLKFDRFTRQAGDTSIDDNPEVAQQVVWLSNFAMNTGTIKGIKVPESGEPAQLLVEFRIVNEFMTTGYYGTIITEVFPVA